MPGDSLTTRRALLTPLFDPLIETGQMKIRLIDATTTLRGHPRIALIKTLQANDAFITRHHVVPQTHDFGHFVLQLRTGQDNFVGTECRIRSRGMKIASGS
jgi:hypothetical protein